MIAALLGKLNPYLVYIKLALAAAALAGTFTAGWKVKGWQDDAAKLAAVQAAVAKAQQQDEANYQAALEAAQKTEKVRVEYRTITKTVDRWRDRPVAHNVCLDADGVRLANDALRGKSSAGPKPDAAVPGPAGGPGDGRGGGTPR